MPEDLTPITREETYLSAIAGEDVSVPDPVIRKEEFLAAIDDHVRALEEDVSVLEEDVSVLEDVVPTPEAADSGKVLTAGSDGTASWQTPSGGGGSLQIIHASGECTYTPNTGAGTSDQWEVGIDTSVVDLAAMFANGPVYAAFPKFTSSDPYYDATETSCYMLIPWLDTYYMAMDNNQDTVIGVKKGGTLFSPTVTLWYEHYPQS